MDGGLTAMLNVFYI